MRKFYLTIAIGAALAACQPSATDVPADEVSEGGETMETSVPAEKDMPAYDPVQADLEEEAWVRTEMVTMEGRNAKMTYSAFGNEPFWDFEFKGLNATYITPEDIEGVTMKVTRKTDGEWLRYSGELKGKPFTVSMTYRPCQDDMSGDDFFWTVRMERDGRTFNGCGKRY